MINYRVIYEINEILNLIFNLVLVFWDFVFLKVLEGV